VGLMKIHGVEKELTFDVTAKRGGGTLTATAKTAAFTFGDFGMQQPRVAVVLSVKDEIRLEVEVAATER
jgi:polyisoprenoid-binding protein YceI